MDKVQNMAALSALLFFLWITPLLAQQTFFRSCECDSYVDGQCAYTITSPVESESVCPVHTTIQADTLTTITSLTSQLRNLSLTASSQAQSLTDMDTEVRALQRALRQPCAECAELQAQINMQEDTLYSVQQSLNTVTSDLMNLGQGVAGSGASPTQLSALQAQLNALQDELYSMTQGVSAGMYDASSGVAAMTAARYWLCHTKAIIVSGRNTSIPSASIAASRTDYSSLPIYARIDSVSAWCAPEPNYNEWLQFDFGKVRPIFGVVSKGRQDYTQWVTTYKFAYTTEEPTDWARWTTYSNVLGEEEIFKGNEDQNTAQVNMLWQPVNARAVRIYPLSAHMDANKCMRADIIGCIDS